VAMPNHPGGCRRWVNALFLLSDVAPRRRATLKNGDGLARFEAEPAHKPRNLGS
jgi:hypothetical protein